MNVTKTWKREADELAPSFEFTLAYENIGDNYQTFWSAVDALRTVLASLPSNLIENFFQRADEILNAGTSR